jgi:uncharacterized protein
MKNISRLIENQIVATIGSNKVLLLLGTRRVGKTFLIRTIMDKVKVKTMLLNGEDFDVQEVIKKSEPSQTIKL